MHVEGCARFKSVCSGRERLQLKMGEENVN